jgi:hypothetical protein
MFPARRLSYAGRSRAGVEIEVERMLPSFRLIAATFLFGFFVVFAGLRMAASLNDIHEGLPVMAAHAAPVSIAPVANRDMRRGLSATPVMFERRFDAATANLAPIQASLTGPSFDRPAPPLATVPSEDITKETAVPGAAEAEPSKSASKPESAVAAIRPDAPLDADSTETASPASKAIEPPAPPNLLGAEELLIHPDPDAAATDAPAASTAVSEPVTTPTTAAIPAAKPNAVKPNAAKPAPLPKPKVAHKKPVRTASKPAPANSAGTLSSPFGALPGNSHP